MRLLSIFIFLSQVSIAHTVLDVRDFGAVGNGSTLNTAAIQQAIDSVSAIGGGTVLITNGTYKSSTIVLLIWKSHKYLTRDAFGKFRNFHKLALVK